MIESLTKEQEAMLDVYVERYIAKGLDTTPFTYETAKQISDYYYVNIEEKQPVPVIVKDSPYAAWQEVCKHTGLPLDTEYVAPYIDGHTFASYFSFYTYMRDELGIEYENNDMYNWYESTLQIGNFYPLDDVCIISQKPVRYSFNPQGQLHGDGVPAIEYADGFAVYCLNDISVPEKLAMTPASALTVEYFKELKKDGNADVCTEFIKKFGKERLLEYGTLVDSYENYSEDYDDNWLSKSEYKLYDMSKLYTSVDYAPHLSMKNLTTNTFHLEAVSPNCKNLIQALDEREAKQYNSYNTIFIK